MKRVVVTDYTFPGLHAEEAATRENGAKFAAFNCKTEEEVLDVARDADVLVVQFAPISKKVIDALTPDAVLIRYGVGYDNIDVPYALKSGRKVCYVPDYCLSEVADHAVSLLLAQLRHLKDLDASVRRQEWQGVQIARGMKAFDKTQVGFIGLGRIGQAALVRLKPFGFRLCAHDPYLDDAHMEALGIEGMSLDRLLRTSDALMLHLPLTKETRHIINAQTIAAMKQDCVIINCSRGDLIDEAALADALSAGRVRAGLDVLSVEPPVGSPLLGAPNSVLTPHIAWYSESAISNLQRLVADEINRALRNLAPRCPVPQRVSA